MNTQQLIRQLEAQLDVCLRRDQFQFRSKLKRLKRDTRLTNDELTQQLTRIAEQITVSATKCHARRTSIPELVYPSELPVVEKRQDIAAAILANQTVIICGETGSGKTTQLPKICLELGRGTTGFIGHTQPRRIAARSVAARIAEELKQPLGQAVGYKMRFHDKTHPDTLVKLMTDGILLAEIQSDPYLDQYDTLIIDEAHERSLNIDFLLGYLKHLLPKRRDLKLIITSATIDPERFSRHFENAPIINVSGRTYPVEMRYRPVRIEEEDDDETDRDLQQAILDAVDELARDRAGDILIFLSGEREIRETAESLRKHHPGHSEILPLYSRLSEAEQHKIFESHGKRRIVLATNVAETSLTVPGIHAVIDTGHARISRYSHRSKLQRLPIEKISQASANQRAGRCGRVGPGICIRLYSEEDYLGRPEFTDPEILRTHLAAVILQMKTLGLGDISAFPFVEPPDERMVRDGIKTLQELNALDDKQLLTSVGRQLAQLPVDPRLGRMLLAAAEFNCLSEVSLIVAGLSLQDPRERPADFAQAADQKHARYKDERSDFLGLLKLWDDIEKQKKELSNSKLRKYCRDNFISYLRMRDWEDIHHQIMQVIKGALNLRPNQQPAEYADIHRALLTGLLSNVGFKQEDAEYVGARGLKFQIHPGSYLYKGKPKWLLAAEQVETSKVYARMVAKIEPEWVEQCGAHLIKHHYYDPHWERKAARVAIHERTTLYSLNLTSGRKVPYEKINPREAREIFIREALVHQHFDSRAPFFRHNQELLAELDYLQQKGRRVDLLEDETWLYQFYDERLPDWVCSGITLDKWRRQTERSQPDLLNLTREMLTRQEDERLDTHNFPDELDGNGFKLKLHYRFEPGHEDDGVTVLIPLHQLNQLTPEPFTWLVPGLLQEKIIGLIKSLPKQLRRHFVPAPTYAERALSRLLNDKPLKGYTLPAQLALTLKSITGISIPLESWQEELLPMHLRMNFRLVDQSGKTIAASRNLTELQTRHGSQAQQTFQNAAIAEWHLTGHTEWDFPELPDRYATTRQGQIIMGFPALVDEGRSVGVKLFDTPEQAARQHKQGLVRLLQLTLAKECKYLHKNIPLSPALELAYNRLPRHPFLTLESTQPGSDVRETIVQIILSGLFLDNQDAIRSKQMFEQRIDRKKNDLLLFGSDIGRLIAEILQAYDALSKNLAKMAGTPYGKDLTEQLYLLIHAGFLQVTPYSQLKEFPRYLKAMHYRLDKAHQDPGRDQRQFMQVQPFWQTYWDSARKSKSSVAPSQDAYRWALEEFRVSLFAQALKTAYPISAKRLEELRRQG